MDHFGVGNEIKNHIAVNEVIKRFIDRDGGLAWLLQQRYFIEASAIQGIQCAAGLVAELSNGLAHRTGFPQIDAALLHAQD